MVEILLIEDSDMQAGLIRAFVMDHHTLVGRATTADEAVDHLAASDPELVIMDLNLEQGNGIEATERIKSMHTDIPILISTVNVSDELKTQAFEAGADAYLTKPYGKGELIRTIDRLSSDDAPETDGLSD